MVNWTRTGQDRSMCPQTARPWLAAFIRMQMQPGIFHWIELPYCLFSRTRWSGDSIALNPRWLLYISEEGSSFARLIHDKVSVTGLPVFSWVSWWSGWLICHLEGEIVFLLKGNICHVDKRLPPIIPTRAEARDFSKRVVRTAPWHQPLTTLVRLQVW